MDRSAQKTNPDRRVFTIPNLMTLTRLILLIPIIWCLARTLRWCAFSWAILGIMTDLLDGWVARRLNQASDLGRMMDPVVDKINVLSVTLFMALSPDYDFPLWFFIFMAVRECLVLAGGLIILRQKKSVPESGKPGKWSAFVTGLMILVFMVDIQPAALILLWISLGLTLYSSYYYGRVFIKESQ